MLPKSLPMFVVEHTRTRYKTSAEKRNIASRRGMIGAIQSPLGFQCGTQDEYLAERVAESPRHIRCRGQTCTDPNDWRLSTSLLGYRSCKGFYSAKLADKVLMNPSL